MTDATPTEGPAGPPAVGAQQKHPSRLLLLNPGMEPTPVPEDRNLADLLDLIRPGGGVAIRRHPDGPVAGHVTRTDGQPRQPVIEMIAAGVHNPGEAAVLLETDGYVQLGEMCERVEPGGFLSLHSPRLGETGTEAVDLRQRVVDWLDSTPAP
jgi:hypothetical protein